MSIRGIWKATLDSPTSYRLARWGLALVFLYSGVVKLPDLEGFAEHLSDYGVVPEATVYTTAVALVTLELLAGVGLAFEIRASLAVMSGLLIVFSLVLAYGISLGLEIECGCFGIGGGEGTLASALGRNVALLALCAYLYCWRSRNRDSVRPRSSFGVTELAFDSSKSSESHEDES